MMLIAGGLLLAAFAVLTILWLRQLRTQDATNVDVAWSFLIMAGAIAAGLLSDGDVTRRTLVATMAAAWALRLGVYLLTDRVFAGHGEDGRYRALRNHWGARASRNFLWVYLGQGAVASLFVVPVAAAMRGGPLDAWAAAGVVVWCIAVAGETIADRQLARFRANAAMRGEVCRDGLWKYSRHPNYFFEWVHWWAYVCIGHGALLTFIGPAAMLVFLFRITGIPYTELQAAKSRGEKYREYQRTTNVFFPWPPRKSVA